MTHVCIKNRDIMSRAVNFNNARPRASAEKFPGGGATKKDQKIAKNNEK